MCIRDIGWPIGACGRHTIPCTMGKAAKQCHETTSKFLSTRLV
jgi:hypothetical protein